MRLIEKDYFTLIEVMEHWKLPRHDLVYLVENGHLKLSIRLFGVWLESGYFEDAGNGGAFTIPYDQSYFEGLLDLSDRDAHLVFKDGAAEVSAFRAAAGAYCNIIEPSKPIVVRVEDLLVRREERQRAEDELNIAVFSPVDPVELACSADFHEIRLGDVAFHLGQIQANVVRLLHRADTCGKPWCSGKVILAQAGSRCTRMADVFKSQPEWRRLIESDGRGNYRLIPIP